MLASKSVSRLLAAVLVLAASTPVLAGEATAGKAKAAQCFLCHGADGLSKVPDAPNLAGQNEAYLVSALKAYRSGKREHEVMSVMAKNLSDDDIGNIAAYFSSIAISIKAP